MTTKDGVMGRASEMERESADSRPVERMPMKGRGDDEEKRGMIRRGG
jgi:hypothetical protein